MTIDISLLQDRVLPVVYYYYQGHWTVAEWFSQTEAFYHQHQLFDQQHVIIGDHRESTYMPDDILVAMRQVNAVGFPPSVQSIVLITQGRLFHRLFSVIERVYPAIARRYHLCHTLDDARLFINSRNSSRTSHATSTNGDR